MKTYLIRSIKYLIWLALLFTLIFVLMIRTNTARAGGEQMLHELFHTQRGWMMIGMLMVLAFLYPRFGFTSRSLKGSVATNRDDILRVAHRGGFSLVSETPGQLVFRASSPGQKSPFAMGGHNHRHSARRSTRDRRHPQRGRSDGIPPETDTRTRAVTCRIPDALQTNRKAKSF